MRQPTVNARPPAAVATLADPERRPRPSAGILVLLPVIAAIALVCTWEAVLSIGRVDAGFFLWRNNFVPAIDVIDSPAVHAGLRYQSRLVAVDGTPVESRDDVEQRVAAAPAGTPFRYRLEKGGLPYEIVLPSRRIDVALFAVALGNYLLNGLVFLGLGTAIIFLDPVSRGARSFFVFCVNYGLYLMTAIDLVHASHFQTLYFFLVTVAPVTALHMALEFPSLGERRVAAHRLLPPLYVAALALGAASNVAFSRSFALLMVLDKVTHVALAAAFLAALAIGLVAYWRATTVADRQRLKIFLIGLAGASLAPAVVLLAVYTAGAQVPLNYLTLGFAIFPAAIAYAIARHELFGVDRVVRRTVGYVAVTIVIGFFYAAVLAILDYVVLPDLSVSPAFHVLVTMVLVVLFNPLRTRTQALVDLVYFRAPYDYRRTVAAASDALASLLDLDEVVARLGRIITVQMQVERVSVWLRDPAGTLLRRQDAPGEAIDAGAELATYLETHHGRPVHVGESRRTGRVPAGALRELVATGAVLAVPMSFEQRLVGFLSLGEKSSGRLYSTDDLELLATLANQAAVAVQNARAYHALADANRELREARDQLVESERLAAIGELSAAVAHGIRNPVAGIKSAAEFAVAEARPDDPMRESLADILTEADALDSRISELLDFARPFAPNHLPGDLSELARGSLHLLRRQITERDVTVDAALADDLPPHELDAAQIEQVCLALGTNAIESMPAGGTLRFTTAYLDPPGVLELRVGDTGHGIPPDELGKVFRLFYTRKARGTGVGLAIVKRIVEGHQGRIEVTSTVGVGTEFTVCLPLHPARRGVPTGRAAPDPPAVAVRR